MTREQADREAKKRWGKKAYWRVGPAISSPERREKARAEVAARRDTRTQLEAEIKRREEEAGIPALREQIRTLRTNFDGDQSYYKFNVGFVDGIIGAFNIIGSGDTWEEAFTQADERRRRTA